MENMRVVMVQVCIVILQVSKGDLCTSARNYRIIHSCTLESFFVEKNQTQKDSHSISLPATKCFLINADNIGFGPNSCHVISISLS